MGWQPRSLNWIAARAGGDVAAVAGLLAALTVSGRVVEERGWWQRLR
jgi:predicted Rossmann fold nucleotide-binding protein DprA/Smf involved in DNA uptake